MSKLSLAMLETVQRGYRIEQRQALDEEPEDVDTTVTGEDGRRLRQLIAEQHTLFNARRRRFWRTQIARWESA